MPTAHAQSDNSQNSPVCDLKLDNHQPGVFCVSAFPEVKITPGNSNETEAQIKAQQEKEAKAKKALAARLAIFSRPSISSNVSSDISIVGYDHSQCVPFARAYSGIQVTGVARYVPVNSSTPALGAVVITFESAPGHAAVVVGIDQANNSIRVREANFIRGVIDERTLPLDSRIKGFVNPN